MRHVALFSDVRGAGGDTDVGYVPLALLTIASYLSANGVPARVIDEIKRTADRLAPS